MGLALKTVVVTGASSGIGAEYVRQISERYQPESILVIARRIERLEELASNLAGQTILQPIKCDLTNIDEREKLTDQLANTDVDLLVNNAGFGSVGAFELLDSKRQEEMVELNSIVPLLLARTVLPSMKSRNTGAIINVASTAAFQPIPYMATYGATKAFLVSWSLALAAELRKTDLTVLAHCPGPTESEFHLAAGLPEKMSHLPAMKTPTAVSKALDAFERGRTLHVSGALNSLLSFLPRVLPAYASALIVEKVLHHHSGRK